MFTYSFKKTTQATALVATLFAVTALSSQTHTAHAQVHCGVVQALGNHHSANIVNAINRTAAGAEYRINKRKRLRLNRVQSLSLNGCRASVKAHVTLKRKVRRDGHGPIYMTGNVQAYLTPLGGGRNQIRLCLSKLRVNKVKLSRTTRVGEGAYKFVANKVMPKRRCFTYNP